MINFNDIEFSQRISLLLNFIFTVLSFKIALSYELFKKCFSFLSFLNKYISVTPNSITICIGFTAKGNLYWLISVTLFVFTCYTFYPKLFSNILFSPNYFFKWGVGIWNLLAEWYYWIVNIFVNFILFLFGIIFYAFLWGQVIFSPIKMLLVIFESLRKIRKPIFEGFVFFLFVISWIFSFYLTFKMK